MAFAAERETDFEISFEVKWLHWHLTRLQTAACHQKTLHPFLWILLPIFRIPKGITEILQSTADQLHYKLLQRRYTKSSRIIRKNIIQLLQNIGVTLRIVYDFTLSHTIQHSSSHLPLKQLNEGKRNEDKCSFLHPLQMLKLSFGYRAGLDG